LFYNHYHYDLESVINQVNTAQEEIAREQNRIREENATRQSNLYNDSLLLPWETDDESKAILSQALMEDILSLSLGIMFINSTIIKLYI
jgi:hypothetical protein